MEYIAYRFAGFWIQILPWHAINILGTTLGMFCYRVICIRRSVTLDNLRHAFPEKTEKEIDSIGCLAFQNLAISMLELFWFSRLTEEKVHEYLTVNGLERISGSLAKGKGLIMISSHISNWEFGALGVGVWCGYPIKIIVKKQRNPYVDRYINRARTKFQNEVVDMDKAPREILIWLRNNLPVGIVADQSAHKEGVFVNFFGRPVPTHAGPAVFALRTGAPMLLAVAHRLPNGHYVADMLDIDVSNVEGTDEEKIQILTDRHTHVLEAYIRQYPEQWLWMHKRWKHTDQAPAQLKSNV